MVAFATASKFNHLKTKPLHELRRVVLHFQTDNPMSAFATTEHFVLASDLDKFIKACEELHHKPGVNPHNGVTTSHLSAICVYQFSGSLTEPYWWSCPGLNYTPDGAVVITFDDEVLHRTYPKESLPKIEYNI